MASGGYQPEVNELVQGIENVSVTSPIHFVPINAGNSLVAMADCSDHFSFPTLVYASAREAVR